MLTVIREKLTGTIAAVILILIGIPFLFFGIGNYNFLGQTFAAKVDGSEISVTAFEQAYRDELNRNPSWAQLPDELRQQLRQSILDSMIRNRLIDMYVIGEGYQISDRTLTRTIQRYPDFQKDGVFDMDTYRSILLQNNLDPTTFEGNQRRALREDQLRRAIAATSLVTPAEYRRYLNLVGEQRLVSLASLDVASATDEVEVTDEAVATYYEDNGSLYETPESADIEMIEIRRDAVAQSIQVSDADLQDYYDQVKDRYLQDEQREARHILILADDDPDAAETQAKELMARIQAGEPFEDLARTYSKDGGTAANGGDLGVLTKSQLPGELGDAIFSMQEGEVRGPVRSDFGFHIIRLDKIFERGPLPLDQVRGDLLGELQLRQAESAYLDLEKRLSDALFDAPDMQAISDAIGVDIQFANGVTREGGDLIGSNQAAIDAIFDPQVLDDGQISEMVELDANRSAVFSVVAHHDAARKPLDEVREQIVEAIKQQQAQQIVFNRSEQLLQALDNGEDFGAAAEAVGATVSPPTLISRQDQTVDAAVTSQVFQAKKPTADAPVRGVVANAQGGYTVYSLDAVVPGRPEAIPVADRDAGKVRLAQQTGLSEYVAFIEALYERADVVISSDALAQDTVFQ